MERPWRVHTFPEVNSIAGKIGLQRYISTQVAVKIRIRYPVYALILYIARVKRSGRINLKQEYVLINTALRLGLTEASGIDGTGYQAGQESSWSRKPSSTKCSSKAAVVILGFQDQRRAQTAVPIATHDQVLAV